MNVPFSVGSVRAALAEPARVARCVPGLQTEGGDAAPGGGDAAAGTTEGRLRVRIANSTITYRGSLTVTPKGEEFTVEGSGTEARGSGSVRLNLTVVPRRAKEGEGTRLVVSGTLKGDGRIKDVEPKAALAAGQRLLERFGKALAESIEQDAPQHLDSPGAPAAEAASSQAGGGIGEPDDNERVIPGIPGPAPDASEAAGKSGGKDRAAGAGEDAETQADETAEPDAAERPERPGVFETEVPPSSLEPLREEDEDADRGALDAKEAAEAEAAHARRTMIGRSEEEVDHAPPRGRYAPVPVPDPSAESAAARWVAPAAAAVVAGAVFIGRILRRRR